jgi:hypothetical protein
VHPPRAETLFRIGAVVACAIVALPEVARPLVGDIGPMLRSAGIENLSEIHVSGTRVLLALIAATTAALFGTAFWLNTARDAFDRHRRAVTLLIAQSVIAALSLVGYFFIVAAQMPFVLAQRAASCVPRRRCRRTSRPSTHPNA